MDNDDAPRPVYRPYQPQDFDAGEPGAPAQPPAVLEGDFHQGYEEEQAHQSAFDERPHETGGAETDFASLKFQRENTLLTNAESYAASIREEAQLYVKQLRSEVEALNKEAEARYAEAERIKGEAEAEAERLVAEAKAAVEELRAQAHQEGVAAGHVEGERQRYAEAGPQLEYLETVLTEIAQFRRRVAFYTEKDGVRLALLIAKKVLGSELKTNKQAIAKLLASTLSTLQGKGMFRVWLNPEDHKFMTSARASLEKFLDEDQSLTLRAKPELARGNVLIETDREVIDLTFQSQFYHLEQLLTQTLAERESRLTQPRTTADAASGDPPATRPPTRQAEPQAPPNKPPNTPPEATGAPDDDDADGGASGDGELPVLT